MTGGLFIDGFDTGPAPTRLRLVEVS